MFVNTENRDLIENLEFDAAGIVPEFDDDGELFNEDEAEFEADEANPCKTSFDEYKSEMKQIETGIWKMVTTPATADALQIDVKRHRVTFRYSLYQEGIDKSFDSKFCGKPSQIDIYDSRNPQHLDGMIEAVCSMRKGERSQFIIGYEKMFKKLGCPPRVEPEANILADIEIEEVTEIGNYEEIRKLSYGRLNTYNALKDAFRDARHRAKDLFSRGLFLKAVGVYKRILDKALFVSTANEEEKKERNEIIKKSYLNVGICYNKLENYLEALNNLNMLEQMAKAITQDPKFLYHKGKALMMKGDYMEAKGVIQAGLALSPADANMRKLARDLQKRTETNETASKEFAKKFILG